MTYSMRSSDFRLNNWDSHRQETNTEALYGTPGNETAEVWCESLNESHGKV